MRCAPLCVLLGFLAYCDGRLAAVGVKPMGHSNRASRNTTAHTHTTLATNHIVHSAHHAMVHAKEQKEAELLVFALVVVTLSVAFVLVVRSSMWDICSIEKNPTDLEDGEGSEKKGFMQANEYYTDSDAEDEPDDLLTIDEGDEDEEPKARNRKGNKENPTEPDMDECDSEFTRKVKRKNSGIEFAESDDESVISEDDRRLDGDYLDPVSDDDCLLIAADEEINPGGGLNGPGFSSAPAIIPPPI